jgi:hypothetical protein
LSSSSYILLHDGSFDERWLPECPEGCHISLVTFEPSQLPDPEAYVLSYLSDETLRSIWLKVIERQWKIGILPHPEAPKACSAYGVDEKIPLAIAKIIECEAVRVDTFVLQ